jgi:hypothetical protein
MFVAWTNANIGRQTMRLIDADAFKEQLESAYEYTELGEVIEMLDNAPTVEYPEQITIKCDTEEDKQKLLSAFRNAKLNAIVEEERPIESITTKGGMTLSLKKTDIEISDLVRCIATVLKDITVEELANQYNTITFTDDNSGESVSYCRVDNGEEVNNEQSTNDN